MDTENILEYFTEGTGEYVIKLFPPDYDGVCVDIGAYDPFWLSNSYLFEKEGWKTYCIEPNPHCMAKLKAHRKNVIEYACSNANQDDVDFFIYHLPQCGEASGSGLIPQERVDLFQEQLKVNSRTLDWLMLNIIKEDHIDFLSIDVEYSEMKVLAGTSLAVWKPFIIAIENIDPANTEYANYLINNGYEWINRIVYNDIYRRIL